MARRMAASPRRGSKPTSRGTIRVLATSSAARAWRWPRSQAVSGGFVSDAAEAVGLPNQPSAAISTTPATHQFCSRFNTVLGPGSDSYHESHVHLDLAERSSGYKMCQWDVREPTVAANVPLPPPRPSARDNSQNKK